MQDGPALTADHGPAHAPAPRAVAVSRSLPFKRLLRTVLSAVTGYDSWVWRLALVAGIAAYGLAMAIAMSAHPHI